MAKPKPRPHQNPYRNVNARTLDETRAALLDDYAERLEYFAALPEWQSPENVAEIKKDPAAWGLTQAELNEWCAVILEHWAAGSNLGDMRTERNRRLYEAARARVSSCETWSEARALCDGYKPPQPAGELCRRDGEAMREYVSRIEEWYDAVAERNGAMAGEREAYDRWNRERSTAVFARWEAARLEGRRNG